MDSGVPSLDRERYFLRWIDKVRPDLDELFILGDLFEFFFEYRHAVPRGFTRILGRLAMLSDEGIPIHYFVGNHDLWLNDYLHSEVGMRIYHEPAFIRRFGTSLWIGHGDGLSPFDGKYRMLKRLFTNPAAQWLYRWLHPDIGIPLARYFSHRSRQAQTSAAPTPFIPHQDGLVRFARQWAQRHPHLRYIIMGHRHIAHAIAVGPGCTYYNTGDWLERFTYGRLTAAGMQLWQYLPATNEVRPLGRDEIV